VTTAAALQCRGKLSGRIAIRGVAATGRKRIFSQTMNEIRPTLFSRVDLTSLDKMIQVVSNDTKEGG
jgi:hypothetical protein